LSYKYPEAILTFRWLSVFAMALATAMPLGAQTVVEVQTGIEAAKFVPAYSVEQRAAAMQIALHLSSPPILGAPVSLTPNAPYTPDGSHLSFWKPSFVIGTQSGGEAGINFWGKFQEGHMNVGFINTKPVLLDCRMLSAGLITYKVYEGGALGAQGEVPLRDGHFLLVIPAAAAPASVELWPTPGTQPVGIFGCDLNVIKKGMP
jgi:hypothetical protein